MALLCVVIQFVWNSKITTQRSNMQHTYECTHTTMANSYFWRLPLDRFDLFLHTSVDYQVVLTSSSAVASFLSQFWSILGHYFGIVVARRIKWKQLQEEFSRPTLGLKLVGCCSVYVHQYVLFLKKRQIRYKELFPDIHFYMGFYSIFCRFIGITFTRRFFNRDNGTVKHILSYLLNTKYELYNKQYINHRHRVYCCIDY